MTSTGWEDAEVGNGAMVGWVRSRTVASFAVSSIVVLALAWPSSEPTPLDPTTTVSRGRAAGDTHHEARRMDPTAHGRVIGRVGYQAGTPEPELVADFSATSSDWPSTLSAIELEILRLTNQLRTDPSGPWRRRADLPPCVADSFYRIAIDPGTGLPEPAPPLEMSEITANALARSWAIEMALSGEFRHRSSSAQHDALTSLDLPVTAWGENIAWSSGYPPEDTAPIHFTGWRESETSHYCALITPRFTHVGIGELRMGDESWAVQNFYTTNG